MSIYASLPTYAFTMFLFYAQIVPLAQKRAANVYNQDAKDGA